MSEHEQMLGQMKVAFPLGDDCPYCGRYISPINPPLRVLVSLTEERLYCSREHFELKHWGKRLIGD